MHKQAAINTAKLLASALLVSVVVAGAVNVIPMSTLLSILGVSLMGYMVWIFYSIEKTRLEGIEKLNELRSPKVDQ